MSSLFECNLKDYQGLKPTVSAVNGDVSGQMENVNGVTEDKQRVLLVEWLCNIIPNLNFGAKASDEEIRDLLVDGAIFSQILKKLRPGSSIEEGYPENTPVSRADILSRLFATLDELGLPRFQVSDLEKGSINPVVDCLLAIRTHLTTPRHGLSSSSVAAAKAGEERRRVLSESKFQRARSSVLSESSTASLHHVGHKFQEVFQLKQGRYADLSATKLSEMLKSNSIDNAPTASLLSLVNGILDESLERTNGEVPHRAACLLRKVVQEIERRVSTQSEHLRIRNDLFKSREERYQSRIKVLEALASRDGEDTDSESTKKIEPKQKDDTENVENTVELLAVRQELEIAEKKHEQRCLELEKELKEAKEAKVGLEKRIKELEGLCANLNNEVKEKPGQEERMKDLKAESGLEEKIKELERMLAESNNKLKTISGLEGKIEELEGMLAESNNKLKTISGLEGKIEELERMLAGSNNKVKTISGLEAKIKELEGLMADSNEKMKHKVVLQERIKELEELIADSNEKMKLKVVLQQRIDELEGLLENFKSKVKALEARAKAQSRLSNSRMNAFRRITDLQLGALRELTVNSDSMKKEVLKTQNTYAEEFLLLGVKIKALSHAALNYDEVLAENRKMFNELQDLKGNIRVFCRIRPFLPGQSGKQTVVDSVGDNGELVVANPSKPGKDGNRSFRFNKVYGAASTQVEVFSDIKPLVRSVLDGYNVCIFAYGQTGSGKTYTMTGPDNATEEDWGVNYRALNDLFKICQSRRSSIMYEIGVQMVEIYNEQVRDLLTSDSSQRKKLGIVSSSQATGLAVPDASMHPVTATSDVLDLMEIGLNNRTVSATAMNQRSSRSHSIITIHVQGKELKSGNTLRGNLHLVDLAGSERVDRSEVIGAGLKEAQHINKSLSALGDVIFALAQKSSHIPYRNSKLTQVLQSSLGGQAKTLMFVQLNPDTTSYSETMSTLKFAERVSGVELGAAKSSKDGKDSRELVDQVASLKDIIAKKDEEIERLQLVKDLKNIHTGTNGDKRISTLRNGSFGLKKESPSRRKLSADSNPSMDDERLSDVSDPDASPRVFSTPPSSKVSDGLDKSRPRTPRSLQRPGQTAMTTPTRTSTVRKSSSATALKSPTSTTRRVP